MGCTGIVARITARMALPSCSMWPSGTVCNGAAGPGQFAIAGLFKQATYTGPKGGIDVPDEPARA